MKAKNAVFAESPYLLHDSSHSNIIVPRARGLISMTMWQPNKRQCLMTSVARDPLLTAPGKQEDLLDMADAAVSTILSGEAKRAMEVPS